LHMDSLDASLSSLMVYTVVPASMPLYFWKMEAQMAGRKVTAGQNALERFQQSQACKWRGSWWGIWYGVRR
jgi:hypothetical protein